MPLTHFSWTFLYEINYKGLIWSKWSYCQRRVVWVIHKHLRPIPSPTVENLLRNRILNLKNGKSENFKMLRSINFNFFSPQKKTISSSYMWISGYDIIYNWIKITLAKVLSKSHCPTKWTFYWSNMSHLQTHPSYMVKVYTIQVWLFLHQNYVLYRIDKALYINK